MRTMEIGSILLCFFFFAFVIHVAIPKPVRPPSTQTLLSAEEALREGSGIKGQDRLSKLAT